jgi:hypothetical protein
MKQKQRQPDTQDNLQDERKNVKRQRHPQPVPEFAVGDQLRIIAEADEGLPSRRGKRVEPEPNGVNDRERDHGQRKQHGGRRQGREFGALAVRRYCIRCIGHGNRSAW